MLRIRIILLWIPIHNFGIIYTDPDSILVPIFLLSFEYDFEKQKHTYWNVNIGA